MLFFLISIGCGDGKNQKDPVNGGSAPSEVSATAEERKGQTILFFLFFLTAGLGLDPNLAFPAIIGQRLDSLGYSFEVINAGLSGETTASGRNRLDWVLRQPVDVFVLELGANDGLRGIPLEETRKNLEAMILTVRAKYPDARIVLAGMQLPPNMGPEYTATFRKIFPELAQQHQVLLIPFLLDGVGGVPELNQEDGIHPTAEGHRIVAENVWEILSPVFEGQNQTIP
ncbi:MAG: arylesterase [Bacteroidetes bacterium]|nr:MAG: arylesterase [Bacteroidota bacterium]